MLVVNLVLRIDSCEFEKETRKVMMIRVIVVKLLILEHDMESSQAIFILIQIRQSLLVTSIILPRYIGGESIMYCIWPTRMMRS